MRALLIALAACGSTPPHGTGHATPPGVAIEVSLERTPCMGQCPTYKVTIARDGAVSLTTADAHCESSPLVELESLIDRAVGF